MIRSISATLVAVFLAGMLLSYLSPKGWHSAGSSEQKYDMGTIRYGGHDSKSCGTIKSTKSHYFNDDYGLLMQTFSAKKYLGKRLRMTGFMKTRGVEDWAGFMLRVDKEGSKNALAFDNMSDRKITGTSNWKEYRVELEVPENATRIAFGALINGAGQIWFDDIQFEIIGSASSVITDSSAIDPALPKDPQNLDFEQ